MDTQRLIADRYALAEPLPGIPGELSWRAVDNWSGRRVVITRVPMSSLAGDELARVRQQIAREVRDLGGLMQEQLALPADMVPAGGDLWVVSEPLPGVTMASEIERRGVVGAEEVARWGADVAEVLVAVHKAGVLHRNLHAGVVAIVEGRAVVGGFASTVVTPEGLREGVPVHVAPEVAQGGAPSAAADIFALGSMLYSAVEGHGPFPAAVDRSRLLAVAGQGAVTPPQWAGPLGDLLMRMLAPEPAQRPTATVVVGALSKLGGPSPAVPPVIDRPAAPDAETIVPPPFTPGPANGGVGSLGHTFGVGGASSFGGPPPADPAPPVDLPPPIPPGGQESPPALSDRPPATRNRFLWVIVAAIVLVLAIAGGVLAVVRPWLTTAQSGASAPYPPPIGDPRTADPCSVLTEASVQRFGTTRTIPDYGMPTQCVITITDPGGKGAVDLRVTLAAPMARVPAGVAEPHGALTIFREAASTSGCPRTVRLADGYQVFVGAYPYPGSTMDLCAITDAGTQSAIAALASGSLPRREVTSPPRGLTGLDTCSLLDQAALSRVPVVDATRRERDIGGWRCTWGDNPAFDNPPWVRLYVFRGHPLSGQPVQIGGRAAQVSPGDANSPGYCEVDLAQRSYTGLSGNPRVEVLVIEMSLGIQQSAEDACRGARALAEAAAPKLPPT